MFTCTYKVKSIDVEAWSPRQKKYFEVGSCSNLGDAQPEDCSQGMRLTFLEVQHKCYSMCVQNTCSCLDPVLLSLIFLPEHHLSYGRIQLICSVPLIYRLEHLNVVQVI